MRLAKTFSAVIGMGYSPLFATQCWNRTRNRLRRWAHSRPGASSFRRRSSANLRHQGGGLVVVNFDRAADVLRRLALGGRLAIEPIDDCVAGVLPAALGQMSMHSAHS